MGIFTLPVHYAGKYAGEYTADLLIEYGPDVAATGNAWVKLEVTPEPTWLLPDLVETLNTGAWNDEGEASLKAACEALEEKGSY